MKNTAPIISNTTQQNITGENITTSTNSTEVVVPQIISNTTQQNITGENPTELANNTYVTGNQITLIDRAKRWYKGFVANRETDYWSKVQSRDDLVKSCNNIGKNGTLGYDFGFISEGARCNYYDASGNLKSEWLDRVYHKSWIAVSTVVSVIIVGLLGWGLYKFTGGVDKVAAPMQQETLLQNVENAEPKILEQIDAKIKGETQDFLNSVYNAWGALDGADGWNLKRFYEAFKENGGAFNSSKDELITKFRDLLDNGQTCVNDENRPRWVFESNADLYSQFAKSALTHLDNIRGLFSKREQLQ